MQTAAHSSLRIHSASLCGIDSEPLEVHGTSCRTGSPGMTLLGLSETSIRESLVRVRSALDRAGVALPQHTVAVTVKPFSKGLSSWLDLPIAVAVAGMASNDISPLTLEQTLVLGELGLDGSIRPVRGLLAHLERARQAGLRSAIVPAANAEEAALCPSITTHCAHTLLDVLRWLRGGTALQTAVPQDHLISQRVAFDLSDIAGHTKAKRALEIAAAGGHNLLLVGPAGCGRTMLATRLPSILPPPDQDEALQLAMIQSVAGLDVPCHLNAVARPFRAPHHSVSHTGLFGGGPALRPGEITLAHGGVLLLDNLEELPRRHMLELRRVMHERTAALNHAGTTRRLPAAPILVGAVYPCPHTSGCDCDAQARERHLAPVREILGDTFELRVTLDYQALSDGERFSSFAVRQRVATARAFAREHGLNATSKTQVHADEVPMRVARTIANLDGSLKITPNHIAEAQSFRSPL